MVFHHLNFMWMNLQKIKKFHWSDLQNFYDYAIESILILNGWKASCDDKIKHFLNSQKSIILRFGFAFRYSSGTFRPFFGTFWPLYYQLIDHSAQIHQTKLNFGRISTFTALSRPDPDFDFSVRISMKNNHILCRPWWVLSSIQIAKFAKKSFGSS